MTIAEEIRKLAELRDSGALTPEEFERAKSRVFGDPPAAASASGPAAATALTPPDLVQPDPSMTLRRARRDRWIGGVCGGLGTFSGVESWVWRLLFTVGVMFAGIGFLPYVVLWIFVPVDDRI